MACGHKGGCRPAVRIARQHCCNTTALSALSYTAAVKRLLLLLLFGAPVVFC